MRRQRGMTLVEVMVAMLVATVGLLGGLAMIGSVMAGSANARHASEAQVLAQSRLEQLQSLTNLGFPPAALWPPDTGAYSITGTPGPVFVKEQVNDGTGGAAQPMDATGVSNTANALLNLFVREVAWQSYLDPNIGGLWRRIITVRVCWFDGTVGIGASGGCNPAGNPLPSGYHEVVVAGTRLP